MYQVSKQTIDELNAIGLTIKPENLCECEPDESEPGVCEILPNETWKDFLYAQHGGALNLKSDDYVHNVFISLPSGDEVILSLYDYDALSVVVSNEAYDEDEEFNPNSDFRLTYDQCLQLFNS